jgi:hypothetical protein
MLKVDTMLSLDLIESLQSLNRADKLYAMQVLVSNLAQEETMLEVLEQAKNQQMQ